MWYLDKSCSRYIYGRALNRTRVTVSCAPSLLCRCAVWEGLREFARRHLHLSMVFQLAVCDGLLRPLLQTSVRQRTSGESMLEQYRSTSSCCCLYNCLEGETLALDNECTYTTNNHMLVALSEPIGQDRTRGIFAVFT